MKRLTLVSRSLALTMLTFGLSSIAIGQEQKAGQPQNYEELARRIVSASANIKPGDVVVVDGGKHTIPLMEAVAIEAQKAGGMVTMWLHSDRVARSRNVDMPEQFLEQEPRFLAEWLKNVDVYIGLPTIEDLRAVRAGVPQARFAKSNKAAQVIGNMLNEAKLRRVFIDYPTKQLAELDQLDFLTFEKMHWDALNADYKMISEKGNALKRVLQGAKVVRVTAPSGTDFTFTTGDRPITVDDGVVTAEDAQSKFISVRSAWLPGGEVWVAPIETSANGKVVVPRTHCRNAPLTGISFEFKSGKIQSFKADKGAECFNEVMASYTGPKDMFGSFSIGLNPARKVMENPGDYRPGDAAGMVWISTGYNELEGGNNKEPGVFNFPITNATVTVDGKAVVKDGQLAL